MGESKFRNSIINQLLAIATKDIRSSHLLYDKKLYPQSVFYFQQASEKVTKAYGLMTKTITEKDFFDISHKQLKVFRKGLDSHEHEIKSFINFSDSHESFSSHSFYKRWDFKEYHGQLKSAQKFHDSVKGDQLVRLTFGDLEVLLETIHESKPPSVKWSEDFHRFTLANMPEVIDWMATINPPDRMELNREWNKVLDNPENSIQFSKMIVNVVDIVLKVYYASMILFICALVTLPHVSRSRYPLDDFDPLKFYNKKLPIVKMQPEFLFLLKKAIKILNTVNKK